VNPVRITLPFVKETPGALRYGLPDQRREVAVSDIYVRKDKLREAGLTGPWPTEITVTVEVPTA
jgi:hypothetical protein